jgi:hypothetical protein
MSTRRAKQLIYGALYLVFWLCILVIVYVAFRLFFAGNAIGPCGVNCVATSTQPLAVQGDIATFVTSPDHYTFLAQVANVNGDSAAENFDYNLNIYSDASGTILESLPGQSFIYANQVKYLVFPNEVINGNVDHVALDLGDTTWVTSSTFGDAPQFTFQNLTPTTASTTVSIGGEITNSSIASYDDVVVVVLFEGKDGGPIGVSQTEISSIAACQTTDFSIIYPAVPNIDPSENQLFAYGVRGY